ncbi:hypothetical protein BHM03_00011865, partial [Ensete ventricosum]
ALGLVMKEKLATITAQLHLYVNRWQPAHDSCHTNHHFLFILREIVGNGEEFDDDGVRHGVGDGAPDHRIGAVGLHGRA